MSRYILVGHESIEEPDILKWGRWFETANRTVNKTYISDDVEVSTVFLGLDYSFDDGPPLLFETMVFGGEHDQDCERVSTWDEAEAMHKLVVERVEK